MKTTHLTIGEELAATEAKLERMIAFRQLALLCLLVGGRLLLWVATDT